MENNFSAFNEEIKPLNEQLRKPSIAQVAAIFSITIILFVTIGFIAQRNEFYSGIIITEFLLILLPALMLLIVGGYDIKRVLRLKRVKFLSLFLILCIMIFAIPVVGIFNLANIWIVTKLFGRVAIAQPPIAQTAAGLLLNVLVVGGAAGICEEVMFRGVIQRGFERFGAVKAILFTSFLFALIHLDFQKLFGTFLLGALIGFIVYKTDSIFSGMFAHFANNSIAVVVSFIATVFDKTLESEIDKMGGMYNTGVDFSVFENLPPEARMAAIFSVAFMVIFCSAVLAGLIIALIKLNEGRAEKLVPQRGGSLKGMLWFLPAAAIIGFIYFAQGLALRGINIGTIGNALKFLR